MAPLFIIMSHEEKKLVYHTDGIVKLSIYQSVAEEVVDMRGG